MIRDSSTTHFKILKKKQDIKLNKLSHYICMYVCMYIGFFLYNCLKTNFSKSCFLKFQPIIRYMLVHVQHYNNLFIVFLIKKNL